MPILFMAVQCVQCSTMQVKQQNKSSNKWVCAVCYQRQSVLRIHAHGFQARDIRKFVQEFNLSRIKRDGCDYFSPKSPKSDGYIIAVEIDSAESLVAKPSCPAKRRTDRTEYLDPKEDDICSEDGEDPDQDLPTKDLDHFSKRQLRKKMKKMPSKNFSRSYDVKYKGISQKSKGECVVAVGKGTSSKWSEYLDKEKEEFDEPFQKYSINQHFLRDCSKVEEEDGRGKGTDFYAIISFRYAGCCEAKQSSREGIAVSRTESFFHEQLYEKERL
ncbi:MRN complex-interacting protein [Phalaenopsis equestris]|uniref:MRN complex-interacting protein n=1 Tax=Phalaenopsis equestris TaxID=78828 RepID=UPI0009E46CCD|nr:MRN complex-interacting protein [Phalaenopsis equestris]